LKTLRSEIFDPKTDEFGGRIFKNTGDGALAEFGSSVDAVQCAVEIQRALAVRNAEAPKDQQLILRIGISQGDVIVDGEDLYGNGVNVAARMEGLAEAGGICVSGNVQEHIGNSLNVSLEDLGEQTVKNIDRPVRCYRVHLEPDEITVANPPPLPDKPSIAVLPFENMSGDPEQEYFADGIAEDIITALSRIRQFFVIARNTTFVYKGKAVDVQSIAKDLGVGYVVEGSVRKGGNKVRITAQLIDGTTGNHLWANRYDRELDDIFAVQDEITQNIVAQVEPQLDRAEYERARTKPPESLDAWELYHRALHHYGRWTEEDNIEARRLFEQATELDPNFARAFAGISWTYSQSYLLGHSADARFEALRFGRQAVKLDDADSFGHTALGRAHHHGRARVEAITELELAVDLNPNSAPAHAYLGLALVYAGNPKRAIPHMELAIRLSPSDPEIGTFMARLAGGHFYLQQYNQSIEWARKAIQRWDHWMPNAYLTASLAYDGQQHDAECARERLQAVEPRISLDFVRTFLPADKPQMDYMLDGLRKAGLEE
jgi:adenylate cyclase